MIMNIQFKDKQVYKMNEQLRNSNSEELEHFETWKTNILIYKTVLVLSLTTSHCCWDSTLILGHDCFLPNPF
jgi:hypothetical protein